MPQGFLHSNHPATIKTNIWVSHISRELFGWLCSPGRTASSACKQPNAATQECYKGSDTNMKRCYTKNTFRGTFTVWRHWWSPWRDSRTLRCALRDAEESVSVKLPFAALSAAKAFSDLELVRPALRHDLQSWCLATSHFTYIAACWGNLWENSLTNHVTQPQNYHRTWWNKSLQKACRQGTEE